MTIEKMEKIFWEVGEENGKDTWYEIFDSDLFEIVCERIANELGYADLGEYESWDELLDYEGCEEFTEWYEEMAMDL